LRVFGPDEVATKAPYRDVIEALRHAFQQGFEAPHRVHHAIARRGGQDASLLIMPSWTANGDRAYAGLKTVTVIGDNPQHGRPTVQASYLLISADTGATLAIMDGTAITLRRTAAAAALAADYLARRDAASLLMVGAGALAPHVVRAHAVMRPIRRVLVWNRSQVRAGELSSELQREGIEAGPVQSLEHASESADIISCATTSNAPLLRGAWLRPGTHVDLMGAFKPDMRETDGEAIALSRVYVDTIAGAAAEAGDLLAAEREGSFRMADIITDLAGLCRGQDKGRSNDSEITLFKSCGTAIEDLATAILIYERS
jgi:ornithine cyclodeaminase